jgi:hypothetical protein
MPIRERTIRIFVVSWSPPESQRKSPFLMPALAIVLVIGIERFDLRGAAISNEGTALRRGKDILIRFV